MEDQIFSKLIDYGGAIAVILALVFFIKAIFKFKGSGDISKQLSSIQENNLHGLENGIERVERKLDEKFSRLESLLMEIKELLKGRHN